MLTMLETSDPNPENLETTGMYLLQQIRDGDGQAVEAYIHTYFGRLFRLALGTSPEEQVVYKPVEAALIETVWQPLDGLDKMDLRIYLYRTTIQKLERLWTIKTSEPGIVGAIGRLDEADRWGYLLSEVVELSDDEVLEILDSNQDQIERHRKRAIALLGVEGFSPEAIESQFKDRTLPDAAAFTNFEQSLQGKLQLLLSEEQRRQKKRVITLEGVWALLGISILILGYVVFNSIEASALSSQQTPTPEGAEPTIPAFGPFPPTATPLPYEATQANGRSHSPEISQDGRFIVFVSEASNLVPGDSNGAADVFLFDRINERISLVSQGLGGLPADGASGGPSISADGRYIAFASRATNLVSARKNSCSAEGLVERPCFDVYLFDRESEEIIPVTQSAGISGNGDSGVNPWGVAPAEKTALSADGNVISYFSRAQNFGADPIYGGLYLYLVRDQEQIRVDNAFDGSAVNGSSFWPSLSQDGRLLAFATLASNLVSDDRNNFADVFVYDRLISATIRITAGPAGTGANGASVMPALSADGRWLAFRSEADDLVEGDFNNTADVFLHDLQAGVTRLVSANNQGSAGNQASSSPAVSAAGETTAFTSLAADLIERNVPGSWEVYLFDRPDNTLQRATLGWQGMPANGPSAAPQVSGDGLLVVFSSAANNLVEDDVNGVEDIFLYQKGTGLLQRINLPPVE